MHRLRLECKKFRYLLEFFAGLGLGSHVHFVDASDRFLEALEGLIDPEKKRWAIGNTFIDVFRDQLVCIAGVEESAVEDWTAAYRESVGVGSDGTVRLARGTALIEGLNAFVIWDLIEDGSDLLLATGDDGSLYRVSPSGDVEQ